jgi:hypothetical protein
MKKDIKYNGFKNQSYWNQSLWINNDLELYDLAIVCINCHKNVKRATNVFINNLSYSEYTPDGVKWTKTGVYNALMSLKKDSI